MGVAKIKGTNEDVVKEFPVFRAGDANESMHMGAPTKGGKIESKWQGMVRGWGVKKRCKSPQGPLTF